MLLLTIALATTLSEAAEGDIENYLRTTPEAVMRFRHLLGHEITNHLIAIEVIPEGEEIVVPFLSVVTVDGFGKDSA